MFCDLSFRHTGTRRVRNSFAQLHLFLRRQKIYKNTFTSIFNSIHVCWFKCILPIARNVSDSNGRMQSVVLSIVDLLYCTVPMIQIGPNRTF